MSSRFPSAVDTIVRFIAVAMKRRGGKKAGIDPTISARALWLKTHPLPNLAGQPVSKLQKEANLEGSAQ